MNTLSKEQKDLIMDFYFRCGSTERINEARDLITSDPRAAALYTSLESSLEQLDSLKYEPCPNNLVELTIARLKLAASSEQARLESLLAEEQRKTHLSNIAIAPVTAKQGFWRNAAKVASVAAVFLVIGLAWFPFTSGMRQIAWRNSALQILKVSVPVSPVMHKTMTVNCQEWIWIPALHGGRSEIKAKRISRTHDISGCWSKTAT